MLQFTDADSGTYQIESDGTDLHLFHRADEDTAFRVVPMTKRAAIVVGLCLLRQTAPELLAHMPAPMPKPATDAVIVPFRGRVA